MQTVPVQCIQALVIVIGCFACYTPAYNETTRCGHAGDCPLGRACVAGYCTAGPLAVDANGAPFDAPDTTFDARALDAPLIDAMVPVPGQSCTQLESTCGSSGADSCCLSAAVPGGAFNYRDSTPATVSDFYLDKYEVTVGRFRTFVSAGMGIQATSPQSGAGAHVRIAGSGWDTAWNVSLASDTENLKTALRCDTNHATWTNTVGANEHKPINCVTWYEAFAFCIWDGGYLPTEAEWNYAASGGSEQRYYPWSTPPDSMTGDCTYANYQAMNSMYCAGGFANDVGTESPKGDGRWGNSDIGGNVSEWLLDWFGPAVNPCNDCANLTPMPYRGSRGGSMITLGSPFLRNSFPDGAPPSNRSYDGGFRCARAQ